MLKVWNLRFLALPCRAHIQYLLALALVVFVFFNLMIWRDILSWGYANPRNNLDKGFRHPIETLMNDARANHEALLAKQSRDLYSAASRYRARRGRHPPPGFDQWVQAAHDSKAIIVEDYFDRIYKDLAPFWGLETDTIAKRASAWHWVVKVRNGTASGVGDVKGRVPWLQLWTELVDEFAKHLPDVDMPINYMDESRLLVPFDQVEKLLEREKKNRKLVKTADVKAEYTGLKKVDAAKLKPYDPKWYGPESSYWDLAVKTCGPDTPAYGIKSIKDYSQPAQLPNNWQPGYTYKGFVQNWTAALDPCLQPHIRQLHGTFVEPISLSSADEFIPLFGGSKLLMNNEIIIPGAMYLTKNEFYSGGEYHGGNWQNKKDGLIWRGDASGGRTHAENWHHFHRHRLIDMLNSTTVSRLEAQHNRSLTFEQPSNHPYQGRHQSNRDLGTWLRGFSDVGFVRICPPGECDFLMHHFHQVNSMPMKDQYQYKFLPDVDGNSFSARFRGFLRSTSMPLKASIYTEWHDDRLVPWVHFVPLDNTFQDLYPALEFFADGPGKPGDAAAQFIAESGQEWAEKVLRREDMMLYVWRLLLEWARVCDKNREVLGFVDDLK